MPKQEQLSMTTVISMELSPARKPCLLRQKSVTFADELLGTLASHKPPARKLPLLKQKDHTDYGSKSSVLSIKLYRSFETPASPLRRQKSLPPAPGKCPPKNPCILRQKSVPPDYVYHGYLPQQIPAIRACEYFSTSAGLVRLTSIQSEPNSAANNRPRPRQKLDLKLKQPKHQPSRAQQLLELCTVIVLGFLVLVIMFVIFS